jgi:hypothetical protein
MSTWNGVVGTKKSCQQKKYYLREDRYAEDVKEQLRAEGNFVDFHIGVHEKPFVEVLDSR